MNVNKVIEDSSVYKRQMNILNKKNIDYDKETGYNHIILTTSHHDYLFYTSARNINHIFFVKVFNKEDVQQRLVSKTSRNLTDKIYHDKDIVVQRDEKIATYKNTDIGTTTNVNRIETVKETLGHPFKRIVSYSMVKDSKDRLQYKGECIELHMYDSKGKRKTILDDVYCTRVYRLFLRFKGYTSTEIYNILRKEKHIIGDTVLEMLEYLHQAISSYHPFFYHLNGTCKYNRYALKETTNLIKLTGLLDRKYKLCKVNRQVHKDSTNIKPKDVQEWLAHRQALEDKGELWEEIE